MADVIISGQTQPIVKLNVEAASLPMVGDELYMVNEGAMYKVVSRRFGILRDGNPSFHTIILFVEKVS